MKVVDKNGVEIEPGQTVLVHCDEGVREAIVVEPFPNTPTVNRPGFWVDINDGRGVEGIPSYILEVIKPIGDDHSVPKCDDQTMTKRLVDINGDIITLPPNYAVALGVCYAMVDAMEEDGVDRSDMLVIVNRLAEEIRFRLTLLKDRQDVVND